MVPVEGKDDRLSSSLEDYLETIYVIQQRNSVARIKDIASRMAVSPPSVTGAIKSLKKRGLVKHTSYGYVELSEAGKKQAKEIFKIHEALTDFLDKILGMNREEAEAEACKIEHALEPATAKLLAKFIQFAIEPTDYCEGCAERFKEWRQKDPEATQKRLNERVE